MSAMTPVVLNAEFWLLWSARQLLRGVVIGIGMTTAILTMSLFAVTDALGSSMERLQERAKNPVFNRNPGK